MSYPGCKAPRLTIILTWWHHQMETFSALLDIYVGNSPATSEFPAQRPVTGSFDVFFICAWINGWVNNVEGGDSRHTHYDVIVIRCYFTVSVIYQKYGIVSTKQQSHINFSSACQLGRMKSWLQQIQIVYCITKHYWGGVAMWWQLYRLVFFYGYVNTARQQPTLQTSLGRKGPLQSPVTTEL